MAKNDVKVGDNPKLKKKVMSDGNLSLYLDYYLGRIKVTDEETGEVKSKVQRKREFLHLTLLASPRTPIERQQNKDILLEAQRIRLEREQELKEFGRYREQKKNKVRVLPFYDVAYKRMLEDRNYMQICDCEPRFRYIWDHNPSKRQFLETLYVYLDEERSSHRTSERLFIHKNTLTYRIKQIVGIGGWNLDDAYIRNYLRMSAIVIKKNQK